MAGNSQALQTKMPSGVEKAQCIFLWVPHPVALLGLKGFAGAFIDMNSGALRPPVEDYGPIVLGVVYTQ